MDVRITRTLERMRTRMRDKLTVEQLAETVELSPSRFAHLFRAQVGVSPVRYLLQLRMDRARALLERTSLSVTEVRLRVGCTDPSHFARDFRRCHGFSPSQRRILYKERHVAASRAS
jgi:AraC family transcriptional regulator, arabinose operon regulatory protein